MNGICVCVCVYICLVCLLVFVYMCDIWCVGVYVRMHNCIYCVCTYSYVHLCTTVEACKKFKFLFYFPHVV